MTNTLLNYVEFDHISIYSTKWTGQARKYLTQVMVHMQTEHSKVCAKWWRTEYFPVWTNQTQFISILSHIYSASFCKVVEMSWWIAIIELLICSGPDSFFFSGLAHRIVFYRIAGPHSGMNITLISFFLVL